MSQVDAPAAPGAFVVVDVLSAAECTELLAATRARTRSASLSLENARYRTLSSCVFSQVVDSSSQKETLSRRRGKGGFWYHIVQALGYELDEPLGDRARDDAWIATQKTAGGFGCARSGS